MKLDPANLSDFGERYTEAWCSHDPAKVASFFSPEGSLSINGGPASVGRLAISETARGFMMMFPDLQLLMNNIFGEGESAEYHWTLAGTNSGPGGTAKKVCISGFEIWRFGGDGLIAESKGRFDNDDFQRQLERGGGELRGA